MYIVISVLAELIPACTGVHMKYKTEKTVNESIPNNKTTIDGI